MSGVQSGYAVRLPAAGPCRSVSLYLHRPLSRVDI